MEDNVICVNDSSEGPQCRACSGMDPCGERPERYIAPACCKEFAKAQMDGTDSEGYGPLIRDYEDTGESMENRM